MKQYKGNDGTGRTEKNKKSRLSIFDKTKEFREIAEKITELSKRSDGNITIKFKFQDEYQNVVEYIKENEYLLEGVV